MTQRELALFDTAPIEEIEASDRTAALEQYMTPRWAAELLVAQFFGDLSDRDVVLDPACGRGAWLQALPSHVNAFGIEIDPEVAAAARERTGRPIVTGDFRTAAVPCEPTVVLTNPPFSSPLARALLDLTRRLQPARAGFLLPAHTLSFASATLKLMRGFDVEVSLVPRDLYPRVSTPLLFVRLTKSRVTRLIGFALYEEAVALRSMRAQYRAILNDGRRPLWREVVQMALQALGGEASLEAIYRVVEGFRPTANPWWRDAIRREAGQFCVRVREGVFALPIATRAA